MDKHLTIYKNISCVLSRNEKFNFFKFFTLIFLSKQKSEQKSKTKLRIVNWMVEKFNESFLKQNNEFA